MWFTYLLLLGCLTSVSGCQQQEQIAQYEVEHPDRYALRMLAAIIKGDEKHFFIDVTGPKKTVDRQKENFDKFLASLQLDEAKDKLTWKVPEGWKQLPERQMRVASFIIESKEDPLEVKITQFGGSVLDNVNRWRKKLTLPPIKAKDLPKEVELRKLGGRDLIVVDLEGMGEFHAARPVAPKTTPPLLDRKLAAPAPFTYKLPGDWKSKAAGAFTKEAFVAGEGKNMVPVTLSSFPGDAGGLAPNIIRWRGQLGLPPQEDVLSESRKLTISGKQAYYVDLANPKSGKTDNRILGVILPLGAETWFVKMTGPMDVVESHKRNFEAFVQSFELQDR